MTTFSGRCHCGNLQIVFETVFTSANLPLRACQCAFCRAHGAVTAADPSGKLAVHVLDPRMLTRYRFGSGITDFLICTRCGVYVAATLEVDGVLYGTLNVNVLAQRTRLTAVPRPMDYGLETAAARVSRRRQRWTPVVWQRSRTPEAF